MKIALISDIHANLPALEAVLEDIERKRPDVIYCLGDLIGYNLWPNEVIDLIRRHGIATIAGNHDLKVSKAFSTQEIEKPEKSFDNAYKLVGNTEIAYLLTLPRSLRLDFQFSNESLGVLMVHGSPRSINEYLPEDVPQEYMLEMVSEFKADILCFGHTHKPYHRIIKSVKNSREHFHHLINTGSVGKPKDGDPGACYVLLTIDQASSVYHSNTVQVEFVRVPYDVEKVVLAVKESGLLPDTFADNLRNAY